MEQPSTSKSTEQPAPVQQKLTTNSPQIHHKRPRILRHQMKHKQRTLQISARTLNQQKLKYLFTSKDCVQRNLDFSASQHKTKIPVSNKARVG